MKTIAVCGAGLRGQFAYAPFALLNDEVKIVAVADINPKRIETFKHTYGLSDNMCFSSSEELLSKGKLADAIIISTMDKNHYEETIKAINLGYEILLEKPISPVLEECLAIEKLALEKGTNIIVCHVLRYSNFYRKIKNLVDEDKIGRIVNIEAMECVGNLHQAHSFVRGNWSNSKTSSPMILQKCCHDMDIYSWIVGSRVEELYSTGDLTFFNSENAPEGSPVHCLDYCPARENCQYDVNKIYLSSHTGWPVSAISADQSYEGRLEALKTSNYGKCVFHADNNVVDHQTINMKYENGVKMVFTMTAFSQEINRTMRIMGTKGEISASMINNKILLTTFADGKTEEIAIPLSKSGHGGGDYGIMVDFLNVINGNIENSNPISASIHSHVIAFAAEESRLTGKVINIKDFVDQKCIQAETIE